MKRRLIAALSAVCLLLCCACGVPSVEGEQTPPPRRQSAFADALQNSEIGTVLVLGDSISDGNGDWGCLYETNERAAAGCPLFLTDEDGTQYYANSADGQGYVTQMCSFFAENYSWISVSNHAIGGKSAKWFNAHKELAIPQKYDAIFVMLGTNDRSDCATVEEFSAEYASLLTYADEMSKYLVVLVPIPALYDPTDSAKNMDSHEIADAVVSLCEENGYEYIDLYEEFPAYAARRGEPFGTYYFGGTHPCHTGYIALWNTIAEALGLLPLTASDGSAVPVDPDEITCTGCNRADIDGDTPPDAQDAQGRDVYPVGVSYYYTWNEFTPTLPSGAFVETQRTSDGSAVQFAREHGFQRASFSLVRSFENGVWTEWADNT